MDWLIRIDKKEMDKKRPEMAHLRNTLRWLLYLTNYIQWTGSKVEICQFGYLLDKRPKARRRNNLNGTTYLPSSVTSSRCYKTLFGGNLDFPKIKKLKNVCCHVWTCTKCESNAIFKQNYTQKLFSSFKILYSWCFGFSISFITSTTDGKIKGCPKYPKVTHKSCIFTSKVIFFNITQNVGLLFIRKLVTNTFLKNRPIWSHCSLHTINYHLFVFVAY